VYITAEELYKLLKLSTEKVLITKESVLVTGDLRFFIKQLLYKGLLHTGCHCYKQR
jgi:hypothetical protein